MKIAISSTGNELSSQVDPRFGRCQEFIIFDSETLEFEAISNEAINAAGGAGIKAAQLVVDKGAEVVITGNIGPNAFNVLAGADIRVFVGAAGTIQNVIDSYKDGKLQEANQPTSSPGGRGAV
ncbi:MAG TPA: dinitrogenase iron-molybdenum cofactor biosynthesis protein [Actinobacteria bacterium]|nr:dinitrogenase iron-molybdenum cofactor biosynthesis protein [Actinomycetota bacterium]